RRVLRPGGTGVQVQEGLHGGDGLDLPLHLGKQLRAIRADLLGSHALSLVPPLQPAQDQFSHRWRACHAYSLEEPACARALWSAGSGPGPGAQARAGARAPVGAPRRGTVSARCPSARPPVSPALGHGLRTVPLGSTARWGTVSGPCPWARVGARSPDRAPGLD